MRRRLRLTHSGVLLLLAYKSREKEKARLRDLYNCKYLSERIIAKDNDLLKLIAHSHTRKDRELIDLFRCYPIHIEDVISVIYIGDAGNNL